MLWTVVVADLIYKLQVLRDLYADTVAGNILTEIENRQTANPTNPEWEIYLIDEVKSRFQFFEPAEYLLIQTLQKKRHLSAHPVLQSTALLFEPNKETVRACIRNALEAVLLKPPIFSKRIVMELIKDIAAQKALLPDDASLKRYLDAKYLNNIRPDIEDELTKLLWKFSFKLSNQDTNENRDINIRTLQLLYKRRPADFKRLVQNHQSYFSQMPEIPEPSNILEEVPIVIPLERMILFLSDHPTLFGLLSDAARTIIGNYADRKIDLFALSSFLADSPTAHCDAVLSHSLSRQMSPAVWNSFLAWCDGNNISTVQVYNLAIDIYCRSGNFNRADSNFSDFIETNLSQFNTENILRLLDGIDNNSQTYDRRRAPDDHAKIYNRCIEVLGTGFDFDRHRNFYRSIQF
jgi:hypothetical protein